MGTMAVLLRKHDVTALIADEIFIVRSYQEEFPTSEAPCAAVFRQKEIPAFPPFYMNIYTIKVS
jgi:hypothetical protein